MVVQLESWPALSQHRRHASYHAVNILVLLDALLAERCATPNLRRASTLTVRVKAPVLADSFVHGLGYADCDVQDGTPVSFDHIKAGAAFSLNARADRKFEPQLQPDLAHRLAGGACERLRCVRSTACFCKQVNNRNRGFKTFFQQQCSSTQNCLTACK